MDLRKVLSKPLEYISDNEASNTRIIFSKNIQKYIREYLGSPEFNLNSNSLIYNKFNTLTQNEVNKKHSFNKKEIKKQFKGNSLNKKVQLRRKSQTHVFQISKTPQIKQLKVDGIKLIRDISENLNLKQETKNAFLENINFSKKNSEKKILSQKNTLIPCEKYSDNKNANIKSESILKKEDSSKELNSNLLYSKKTIHYVKKHKLYNEIIHLQEKEIANQNSLTLPSYIIYHNSKFRATWDLFVLITVIYSMIISPLKLCFYQESDFLINIEILIFVICIIDFLLNFFTTFHDEEENLITDFNQIVQKYFYNDFLYDLLACFPSEFIYSRESVNLFLYFFFEWIRIIRIYKATKRNLTGRFFWDIVLIKNNSIDRLIKFVLVFLILTHISSCAFIFVGKIDTELDNWIDTNDLNKNVDIYITSLYFNIVTIYTIGYGDIVPYTIFERVYVTMFMFVGILLFSYAISSLSNIFSATNTKNIEYKRKLYILNCISTEYQLNNIFINKIKNVINHEYHKDKDEIEKYELLESLPNNLRNDLIKVIFRKQLKNLKFFKNQTHDFSIFVLPLLKNQKFVKGEQLLSVGDFVTEMYLVEKGTIGINLGSYYDNLEIGILRENCHFGELLMQANEQCPYELVCKSRTADILVLKENDFLKVKTSFFDSTYVILEQSYKQLEILDKRRQVVMELFKFYRNMKEVKEKMKLLNIYLMDEGFINYYQNDVDFQEAYDFLDQNSFLVIRDILDEIMKKNRHKQGDVKMKKVNSSNYIIQKPYEKNLFLEKKTPSLNIDNNIFSEKNNFDRESLLNIIKKESIDHEMKSIDDPYNEIQRKIVYFNNASHIGSPSQNKINTLMSNCRGDHKHHSYKETSRHLNFHNYQSSNSKGKTNNISNKLDHEKGFNNRLLHVDYLKDMKQDSLILDFHRKGKKSSTNKPSLFSPSLNIRLKQKRINEFKDVYSKVSRNLNNNRIQENLEREALLNEKTINLLNTNKSNPFYRNSSKRINSSKRNNNSEANSLHKSREIIQVYNTSNPEVSDHDIKIEKTVIFPIDKVLIEQDLIKEYRKKILNSLVINTCVNINIENKINKSLNSKTIFTSFNTSPSIQKGNMQPNYTSNDLIKQKEINHKNIISSPVFHIHQNVNIYEGNIMKYNFNKFAGNNNVEYKNEIYNYNITNKKLENILLMVKLLT